MATKIRLKRIGRRNRPFYRLVVMDSRKRRDGAAIEQVGWYNPIDTSNSFDLKGERIIYWLGEGAIPTDAAQKLIRRSGLAHRWHLIKQGLNDDAIDKEMKKWMLKQEDVQNKRKDKAAKKVEEKLSRGKAKADKVKTDQEQVANFDQDKSENVKIKDSALLDSKEEE